MAINPAVLTTLAALAGSAIGATAPIFSNYIMQRSLTQRELLNHQIAGRETLYSDFIADASRVHAHSLSHDLEETTSVVSLHALVSRIRLLSSQPVVEAADKFVKRIVQNYGEPNMSMEQIRVAALSGDLDPLHEFSDACRTELNEMFKLGSAKSWMHEH